jgi:hypothetical protein
MNKLHISQILNMIIAKYIHGLDIVKQVVEEII